MQGQPAVCTWCGGRAEGYAMGGLRYLAAVTSNPHAGRSLAGQVSLDTGDPRVLPLVFISVPTNSHSCSSLPCNDLFKHGTGICAAHLVALSVAHGDVMGLRRLRSDQ